MLTCRMVCLLLSALAPVLGACRVETLWNSDLAGPNGALIVAPLARGRVFAVSFRGHYWIAGPDGRIEAVGSEPALVRARALSGGGDGTVYVLTGQTVRQLRPFAPERARLLRQYEIPVFASDIAAGADGRLYAAGSLRGSRLPLHAIGPDGNVEHSFGEDPGPDYRRGAVMGNVLWDGDRERLVFLPWPFREIQVYDPHGNPIAVGGRGWFQPAAAPIGPLVIPRGAALLPGGHLAIRESVSAAGWTITIYSPALERLCEAPDPGLGRLAGASAEGDMYFVDGGRLSCARLAGIALPGGGARLIPVQCATPKKREPARKCPPKPMLSAFLKTSGSPTGFVNMR